MLRSAPSGHYLAPHRCRHTGLGLPHCRSGGACRYWPTRRSTFSGSAIAQAPCVARILPQITPSGPDAPNRMIGAHKPRGRQGRSSAPIRQGGFAVIPEGSRVTFRSQFRLTADSGTCGAARVRGSCPRGRVQLLPAIEWRPTADLCVRVRLRELPLPGRGRGRW
jgi:hypothetical protein